jgi:hypothetical protein
MGLKRFELKRRRSRAISASPTLWGSVDDRMVAATRLILALSAVAVICIDPSEPGRFVAATYAALVREDVGGRTVVEVRIPL